MKYTLFLDESGNISENSSDKYFSIGGYLVESGDETHKFRMKKIIKNINKNRDINFNYYAKKDNRTEVKFANLTLKGREEVFEGFKNLRGTYVSIVVEKDKCTDLTSHTANDYYNYLVRLLVQYIFEVRNFHGNLKFEELNIICDNRSMKISANNNLQSYLVKKLIIERLENKKYCCNFNIKLADSKVNYGVMIADFIAGLCRYRYEGKGKEIGKHIDLSYTSKFPYKDFTKKAI